MNARITHSQPPELGSGLHTICVPRWRPPQLLSSGESLRNPTSKAVLSFCRIQHYGLQAESFAFTTYFWYLICFCPLAVHPLWWFLHLAKTWVFPSCTFFSPFFGRFFFFGYHCQVFIIYHCFQLGLDLYPHYKLGVLIGAVWRGVCKLGASLGVLFWEGNGFEGTSPSKFGNEFGGSLGDFFGVLNQAGFGAVWGT